MRRVPHLILTVDYELFGDGSGCLDACVLQPAERLMQIAGRFDAPLTFFAEVLECMAMAEQGHDHRAQDQLRSALARAHDVQLHIHPQWSNAQYDTQGAWKLDMDRWRIGDLPLEEVRSLVCQGRQWLSSEVASNISGYRCLAFRAGGWCIQPSEKVIEALLEEGILIDSTVAPGQWRAGRGEWSDFRAAPAFPFWRVADDVCRPSGKGLWELPIAAGNIGRWQHLKILLTARKQGEKGLAPACAGSYRGPTESLLASVAGKMVRLQQLGGVMLDLSVLSADALIEVTKQWRLRYEGKTRVPFPIVAISHTKNFTPASEMALAAYLAWAQKEGIVFSTYGHWLEAVSEYQVYE